MKKVPPFVIIVLSFLIAILIGTVVLKLPISIQNDSKLSWIDSFFISTSAICVTGLTPISNIATTFTTFGKFILALLIQVGGLGCISVTSYLFITIGAKFGIGERYLLKEALNQDKVSNIIKLLKSIMKITFLIELLGSLVNFIVFIRYYDFWNALGISIFHSISSFNNAGFDIIGDNSLINYSENLLLNINTMCLIILGGLGFIVIIDIFKNKFRYKYLKIHSKIVLLMTVFLISIGTFAIKISMGDSVTWLESLFQSVSSRTAGFSTISCSTLTSSSLLIMCVLMVIGASPSSTGGGIKTTTIYTIFKSMISFSKGKVTVVNNRKISEDTKLKAFVLFFFALSIIGLSSIIILMIESKNSVINLNNVIFETCSAFATVGLSMGITPYLSVASKLIICILMFVGRIGPITIMGMWNSNWNKPSVNNVDYLEEKIIIG